MTDGNAPTPDDGAGTRRRRLLVRKYLYHRLWGGRTSSETPMVVFLVGSSDIGRGYVVNAFERNFETDVYRSDNAHAFANGALRSEHALRRLIARSRAPAVVFAAGRDSNAVGGLIEHFSPARAIWLFDDYRRFISRARRSGDPAAAREHLRQLGETDDAGGLLPEPLVELAARPDLEADTLWALLWYTRHSGLGRQRLERLDEVSIISADSLEAAPRETVNGLFEIAGIGMMHKNLPRRVKPTKRDKRAPELSEAVQEACEDLLAWLRSHSLDLTNPL